MKRDCTIYVAKTKALISFAVTAKLICVFVFPYAKRRFSHDGAHLADVLADLSLLKIEIQVPKSLRVVTRQLVLQNGKNVNHPYFKNTITFHCLMKLFLSSIGL